MGRALRLLCCVLAMGVPQSCLAGGNKTTLLRRTSGSRNLEECPSKADFQFMLWGERSDTDMMNFVKVWPDLPAHTAMLGFTEEDKAEMWEEASQHVFEFVGVDFRDIPVDANGLKFTPDGDWSMQPRGMNVEVDLVYDSYHGHYDCARKIGDEGIGLFPLREGLKYHGNYGGEEGIEAWTTDVTVYGSYLIDFDGDGDFERFRYWGLAPFRTMDGSFMLKCALSSDRFGLGQSNGKIGIEMDHNGNPHVAFRMMSTFPERWDL